MQPHSCPLSPIPSTSALPLSLCPKIAKNWGRESYVKCHKIEPKILTLLLLLLLFFGGSCQTQGQGSQTNSWDNLIAKSRVTPRRFTFIVFRLMSGGSSLHLVHCVQADIDNYISICRRIYKWLYVWVYVAVVAATDSACSGLYLATWSLNIWHTIDTSAPDAFDNNAEVVSSSCCCCCCSRCCMYDVVVVVISIHITVLVEYSG